MNMAYDITLNSGVKVTVTPDDVAQLTVQAISSPGGRVKAIKRFHEAIVQESKTPLNDSKCFIDKLIVNDMRDVNLTDILSTLKVLDAFQEDGEHDSTLSDPYQEFWKFVERKKKELVK